MAVDQVALRHCTMEDAETLALIGVATFLDAFAGMLPGKSIVEHCRIQHTVENYRISFQHPKCRIWLAETVVQQGPVGYSMVTVPDLPIDDPTTDDLELKRIYLLSRFHGTGAGRRLMEAAIDEARYSGGKRLFLGVYAGNHRALAFYDRQGFRVVGGRTFKMGFEICDDLVLKLDL